MESDSFVNSKIERQTVFQHFSSMLLWNSPLIEEREDREEGEETEKREETEAREEGIEGREGRKRRDGRES